MCDDVAQTLSSWMLGHFSYFCRMVCTEAWVVRAAIMTGDLVAVRTSFLPHPLILQGPAQVPPIPESLPESPIKLFSFYSHRTLISSMAYSKVLIEYW